MTTTPLDLRGDTHGGASVCAYDYLTAERDRLVCLVHRNEIPILDVIHRRGVLRDLAACRFLRGIAAEEWAELQQQQTGAPGA